MKDSQNSSEFNLIQTAVLLPLVALLAIVAGAFLGDGIVQAQESEADGISSVSHESYFSEDSEDVDKGGQLAQSGGLLESRSDADAEDEQVSESTEAGECSTVYIEDDLRIDFDNDPESVLKLQSFLKTFEGYDAVSLTGEFDEATLEAVMSFQTRYAEEILEPWGYQPDEATGYVYITTKKQINEIYCDEQFSLSREQQEEIREYREMLNEWRAQGASFETPNYLAEYYGNATPPAVADDSDVDDTTTDDETTDNGDVEGAEDTQDDAATTSTTTATSTDDDDEEADDRNFFQRLFGIGGDDDNEETATTTATSTDSATSTDDEDDADTEDDDVVSTDDDEDEATTTDDETATSATNTTATGSIDGVASGVYNGINSIFNFLLSPTFLLIVLVVLILLLIATVIEGDGELDDDESDIDPWAEYDETKDVDDEDDANDEDDDNDKAADTETPTPPDNEEGSDKAKKDKGDNSKGANKKQN